MAGSLPCSRSDALETWPTDEATDEAFGVDRRRVVQHSRDQLLGACLDQHAGMVLEIGPEQRWLLLADVCELDQNVTRVDLVAFLQQVHHHRNNWRHKRSERAHLLWLLEALHAAQDSSC